MGYVWQTFGHERIKRVLDLQVRGGSMPHAYLFRGPESVGKHTLAHEFGARLQGIASLGHNHPDYHRLDGAVDSGVEQVRHFLQKLNSKPFVGPYTVAIIDNAQELTREAANALLKLLEEPKQSIILFLIVQGTDVLPTIASRCQIFSFNRFTEFALKEFASVKKMESAPEILQLSSGRPGLLTRFLQDNDYYESMRKLVGDVAALRSGSLVSKLGLIQQLGNAESTDLIVAFNLWLDGERGKISPPFFDKVLTVITALRHSANKKLALQQLII